MGRVANVFFPLDRELDLGTEGYSPRLLAKIEYAGGNAASFAQASASLEVLAELSIGAKHVQRLTERLGEERRERRDQEVEAFKAGGLRPDHAQPPRVVAVHVDAGKVQERADDGKVGVRAPHWADDKVACLVSYTSVEHAQDPQPRPPDAFYDPAHVARLCQEMERVRSQPCPPPPVALGPQAAAPPGRARDRAVAPQPLVRTAVATMAKTEDFGWMVAAEAQRRGFYEASRRAFVGDGGNWIAPLGDLHFPGFTQVLDFLHALVHLYAAALAAHAGAPQAAWELYSRMLEAAWAGRIGDLLLALTEQQQRHGPPPESAGEGDPRRKLALTIEYVRNNATRMDYPRYRREGLPISSAPVESLVKQFNQRVKGTDKFWVGPGVEAVLQVRAAYLSQDDRALRIHSGRGRTARAVGTRRLGKGKAA